MSIATGGGFGRGPIWSVKNVVGVVVGAAAVSLLFVAGQPARGELTHLYTFNDGSASDSVGNAHGQLQGNAFVDGDGLLNLPGGGNDFVSLDGQAIDIASYTDVTFEAWFTADQLLSWQRVFDFGDRTVATNEQGYVYYTPLSGGGTGLGVYANFGQRTEAAHPPLQTGQLYHLAFVIDDSSNGGSDELSVYINGDLEVSVNHTRSLSNVSNEFALLGESLITGDPNFNGSMDEFRMHDNAFDANAVAASFTAGPTPQTTLRLVVDTFTGDVSIVGEPGASISFDYYTITSPAGALDPDGWDSLDEQNLDSLGPGEGQSWDRIGTPGSSQLTEAFLLGASTINDAGTIELGQAFDPTVFGLRNPGDLEFRFSRRQSPSLTLSEVIYVIPEPVPGDYNDDGVVGTADYVVWRNYNGTAFDLPNRNPELEGNIGQADYDYWVANFGTISGSGSSNPQSLAVPEPVSIVLLLPVLVLLGHCRQPWHR